MAATASNRLSVQHQRSICPLVRTTPVRQIGQKLHDQMMALLVDFRVWVAPEPLDPTLLRRSSLQAPHYSISLHMPLRLFAETPYDTRPEQASSFTRREGASLRCRSQRGRRSSPGRAWSLQKGAPAHGGNAGSAVAAACRSSVGLQTRTAV